MIPWPRLALAALAALASPLAPHAGASGVPAGDAWLTSGEVRYLARDPLASWSGVAPASAILLAFDPRDPGALRLETRVEPAAFDSGNRLRDGRARATVFDTDDYPEARLVAAAAADETLPPLAPGDTITLPLDAELTLHGVTLAYRLEVRLSAEEDAEGHARYRAEAEFEVSLTAHGMRRPTLLGLVTDDLVTVSLVATARPDPTPSSTTR